MYKITNNTAQRTITIRLSGHVSDEEIIACGKEGRRATDTYAGRPHLVLADMRGMTAASAQGTTIMYEVIAYMRRRGVACCVHLADSAIARMQALRIAREASPPGADVTIEAVSIEEAEIVLEEQRLKLSPAGR
jgi:hypothetical protein